MKHIRAGNSVVDTQLVSGYESSSGFRDAFSKIMGSPPTKTQINILKSAWLDTPLGPMVVIADEEGLYLLEFVDRCGLECEVERLRNRKSAAIIPGETAAIKSIEKELKQYFSSELLEFKTPVYLIGSEFQKSVWQALQKISIGTTCSYADQARAIGKPTAFRAVANANGMNPLGIIIPCHRVINANGELGGYNGGLARKEWLLKHERELIK
jgi:AraC family transcriptional regulator of adaptative response/methylated-DNA-[protein]-cysteine methyltransferase